MNKSYQKRAEELAEAHWQYVKEALETVMLHETEKDERVNREVLDIIGFHYKTAFIHGYKHGVEDSGPAIFTSKSPIKVFDRNGKRIE